MFRFDVGEHVRLFVYLFRWTLLGAVVGVLAGFSSAFFLVSLNWATTTRLRNPWLLWLLPLGGFVVGLVYHYLGGRAGGGNNLIIDEIHEPSAWIPGRMAPLIYIGTVITQVLGGSAGREGTALQMSGSLTDVFNRAVHLRPADRRVMLIAALSGGFGAVFGVPIAGCVFGLEVQAVGRLRYDALVPALSASLVGDLVVRALGVKHTPYPKLGDIDLSFPLLAKVMLAGLCFGLVSVLFIELTHGIRSLFAAVVVWPPLRPVIGGFMVIGLTYAVGTREYNGLSIGLIERSLAGGIGVATFAFLLKLLFTAVTLGSGFLGGEVTPLFVIGATMGATMGDVLRVPVPIMASVGFVAVFAGAANTPLACTIMGVELFGSTAAPLLAVGCAVSYVFSAHRGISHRAAPSCPEREPPHRRCGRGLPHDVGLDHARTSALAPRVARRPRQATLSPAPAYSARSSSAGGSRPARRPGTIAASSASASAPTTTMATSYQAMAASGLTPSRPA